MEQFQCQNCGYDMTGIEKYTAAMNSTFYSGVDTTFMDVAGLYNSQINNSVRCPNCGQVGQWIRHY
ncbi:MAG: hypothetical protein RR448_06735 [Niameybacter sp.]|uniref:hypothetical protein n=1 Tax=Niameybacter sp. TaxID=2033640 RepID=UPI002FC9FEE2